MNRYELRKAQAAIKVRKYHEKEQRRVVNPPTEVSADYAKRKAAQMLSTLPLGERLTKQVRRYKSGCWVWEGHRNKDGYGRIRHAGKSLQVHRLSYFLHYGHIEPGLNILHRCDNPPCCNPAHLFAGTQLENVQDRDAKGRGKYPVRKSGEFTGENRLINKGAA